VLNKELPELEKMQAHAFELKTRKQAFLLVFFFFLKNKIEAHI
jgi:hypothetical protein